MKTLACSLIAVVSLGFGNTIFATDQEDHQVTGTAVKDPDGIIVIKMADNSLFYLNWDCAQPNVGEKVTVHYDIIGRGRLVAHKVEKLGKTEKGSKKN
jgi:hypothetical protein